MSPENTEPTYSRTGPGATGGRLPLNAASEQSYSESERLYKLAVGTLEVLDAEREETGVDEWDESDPRCFLYNAATAVVERSQYGDENLDLCLSILA